MSAHENMEVQMLDTAWVMCAKLEYITWKVICLLAHVAPMGG